MAYSIQFSEVVKRHAHVFGYQVSRHLLLQTVFRAVDGHADVAQQRLVSCVDQQSGVSDVVFFYKPLDFFQNSFHILAFLGRDENGTLNMRRFL